MTTDTRALVERLRTVLAGRDETLEAHVFGSVARGSARAYSDLDVAVYLADPRPPSSPFGYAADLAAALMAALGAPSVDVVVLNDASPILYPPRPARRDQDPVARPPGHHDPRGPGPVALLRLGAPARQDRGRASPPHRRRPVRPVSPGQPDPALVRRDLLAPDAGVQRPRRHRDRPLGARMHALLNAGLDDFVEFARHVERFLEQG